jgi:hypothetical protein
MTLDKINRRTHLYLGLLLTPWFLLYAVSGFVFNHPAVFSNADGDSAKWQLCYDRPYRMPAVREGNEDAAAQKLLTDQGLTGRYWTDWDDQDNFVVYRPRFLNTIRLTYDARQSRIRMEEQSLGLAKFLTSAHVRSGFDYPYVLEVLWSSIVDLVAVAILIWIVSGLCIWWNLDRFRRWGWIAIAAGLITFISLTLGL